MSPIEILSHLDWSFRATTAAMESHFDARLGQRQRQLHQALYRLSDDGYLDELDGGKQFQMNTKGREYLQALRREAERQEKVRKGEVERPTQKSLF